MPSRIAKSGLSIDSGLFALVENEILPDTGITSTQFWAGLADIVDSLAAENRALLARRDHLQSQIDDWHRANPGVIAPAACRAFLEQIGYLVPPQGQLQLATQDVDPEVAAIAAPQLVVPLDNARYALNAANARWNSLYDALYGSDIIATADGGDKTARYNPIRGKRVVRYVREFLDRSVPLAAGSHTAVTGYQIRDGQLIAVMPDGNTTGLRQPEGFVGYCGEPASPTSILLQHNRLHIDIAIGAGHFIGRDDPAHIYDVQLEAALTTIMDCEDSVAAVNAADKVRVYRNWAGLMKGDLRVTLTKEGKTLERTLAADREYLNAEGKPMTRPGRSLMLVRHVGTHMMTDAVTVDGEEIAETFLDCMVTVLAAVHDLKGNRGYTNSTCGSIYIVKPKMHGPEEVAAAARLFAMVEDKLGLAPNTLKMGIMDEERRTTVNLKECLRAARERVIFINTGFLDRTGDEIHTAMQAGAVLPKNDMKTTPWLLAYENWNVDVGMRCGLSGRGQIGKGMWTAPERMADMMAQKIAHPQAGASTAWVPSPTAATLHALHYHEVDVAARQLELTDQPEPNLDDILTLPLLDKQQPEAEQVARELENNAQGILGYVVRWIDHGVGCSKVLDINDIALMEDRATLRISSQHIANWLHHGLVSEQQVRDVFGKMAAIVDRQNRKDPTYTPMADDLDHNIAFNAALDLVFEGLQSPNGYTEWVLHRRRRQKLGKL